MEIKDVTDYPQVTIDNAGEELNRLHNSIETKMRSTVQDAIRAGEILTRVKDEKSHGEFLPWLRSHCSFSQQSASNYMRLYHHSDKLPTVGNLQDAYRQIETIEKQEAQTEKQKARQRVDHYMKTGEKQEGWRRGTDDKLVEYEKEWQARRADMEREFKQSDERREAKKEETTAGFDFIDEWTEKIVEHHNKRQTFKDRIRLSDSGRDDAFVDALMDYLDELPDDNRRIEACTNIIKVARGISTQLQRGGNEVV